MTSTDKRLAPDEIEPTKGKTEVWVDGKLVGEIKGETAKDAMKQSEMVAEPQTQEEVDEAKRRAEQTSKVSAAKASQSKKEVARMAR